MSINRPAWQESDDGQPLEVLLSKAGRIGIFPVVDDTDRGVLLDFLAERGVPVDADNPVYVHNHARAEGLELERTTDGVEWRAIPASLAPQSYTPANTNLTVGNGAQVARYVHQGALVHVSYRLTFGSTTAISGTLNVGLPVPATAGSQGLGVGYAIDASAGGASSRSNLAVVTGSSSSQVVLRPEGFDLVQATQPFSSWGTGDTIGFEATYLAGV